ncbi:hypothetical protein SNE40_009479 [Patella caerulea]
MQKSTSTDVNNDNSIWGYCPVPRFDCEQDDNDVCDEALDKFIHRIILSASMNDKDEDIFGIVNCDDGILGPFDFKRKPRVNGEKAQERYDKSHQRSNPNRKKEPRKNKRGKTERVKGTSDDMPKGTTQQFEGKTYVHVPLEVYKKMIESEIDSKLKQIQDYYDLQYRRQEELQLESMRESIYWKDCVNRLEMNLSISYSEFDKLSRSYENIKQRINRAELKDKKNTPPHKSRRSNDKKQVKQIVRDMSGGDNNSLDTTI